MEKDLLDLYEDVQRNHTERLTGILPFLCEDGAVGCAGFWKVRASKNIYVTFIELGERIVVIIFNHLKKRKTNFFLRK